MNPLASQKAEEARSGRNGTVLLVANYRPEVGFAWWLMEHFWVRIGRLAEEYGMSAVLAFPVDGPDLERLQSLVREADLRDCFRFAGKRNDVTDILCSSDIALHLSKGEAFSLAILEYMNAGLVTFVPDIPSVCQAIEGGQNGIIYPYGDVDSLLAKFVKLVDDSSLRTMIGQRARRSVRENFSRAAMGDAFDEQMVAVMKQAASRPIAR